MCLSISVRTRKKIDLPRDELGKTEGEGGQEHKRAGVALSKKRSCSFQYLKTAMPVGDPSNP